MKILLLCGESGSGKSTIAYELCQNYPNYNLVASYTDRPRRPQEYDHIFISKETMDFIPMKKIVAFTKIGKYRYCSLYEQFSEDKINVYVVDANGAKDVVKAFPKAEIVTVLVDRENIYIDENRKNRNIQLPPSDKISCELNNNQTITDAVYALKTLCEHEDGLIFRELAMGC